MCDSYECTTVGAPLPKPCNCRSTKFHESCILNEAREHWRTCAGCGCRHGVCYPCPECSSIITIVDLNSMDYTFSRVLERFFYKLYPLSLQCFLVVLSLFYMVILLFLIIEHGRVPPVWILFSLLPLTFALYDAKKLELPIDRVVTCYLLMCMVLVSVATCLVISCLMIIMLPRIRLWSTLSMISHSVATYKMIFNCAALRAMLETTDH